MRVTIYLVVTNTDDPEEIKVLTASNKLQDCFKYLDKLYKLENKDHFRMWCELRGLELNNDSWVKYARTGAFDSEKYVIRKMKYNARTIATIFRLQNGCMPLNIGYETPEELYNFLECCDDDDLKFLGSVYDLRKIDVKDEKDAEEVLKVIRDDLEEKENKR